MDLKSISPTALTSVSIWKPWRHSPGEMVEVVVVVVLGGVY